MWLWRLDQQVHQYRERFGRFGEDTLAQPGEFMSERALNGRSEMPVVPNGRARFSGQTYAEHDHR